MTERTISKQQALIGSKNLPLTLFSTGNHCQLKKISLFCRQTLKKEAHEVPHHRRSGRRSHRRGPPAPHRRKQRNHPAGKRQVHLLRQLRPALLHRRHHQPTRPPAGADPRKLRPPLPHRRAHRARSQTHRPRTAHRADMQQSWPEVRRKLRPSATVARLHPRTPTPARHRHRRHLHPAHG